MHRNETSGQTYNETIIDSSPLIKGHVQIYSIKKKTYEIRQLLLTVVVLFCTWSMIYGQKKSVTGEVRSIKDSGVIQDIVVFVKGNLQKTVTNPAGQFALPCSIGDSIIFSGADYETKTIVYNGHSGLVVFLSLTPTYNLTEVVVTTALGIKKNKELVSYATQEVNGSVLQKAPETNVASNLVGKVAGLSIATKSTMFESPTVSLRGDATLVVLDGVPTDKNSFNFWSLNPNNIENITVLKGTAAAALYGADGKNGAIMVTTKTGKSGANGTEVTFNSTNQIQGGFLRLPKTQTQYGMGWNGYYAFIDGAGGGGWNDDYGYVWWPKLNQKDASTASGYVEVPQYNSPYDPNSYYTFTESGYTDQSHYKPIPLITRGGSDNLKNFLRKGFVTTNNVSFAGKSDKGDFNLSLTNMYQKGQIPNTSMTSTTLLLSGSLQAGEKLKVSGILSYNRQNSPNFPVNSTQSSGSGGSGPADYFYNILLWMGPDVDIRDLRNYWKPSGTNPRSGGYAYGTQNMQQYNYNYTWYDNPYFTAYENINSYFNNVINAQLNLSYKFNNDLNLMVRSGLSTNNDQSTEKEPWSYIDNSFKLQPQGGFSLSQNNNVQIVTDALLTYKKRFLNDFHATVSVGGSSRYNQIGYTYEGTVGGLTLPNYYNLAASVQTATASNQSAEKQSTSIMGYADIDYRSMVYLGITGRNDWVSNLPKPHNSFFYPSANLGIVLSKLLHLPTAISYLKLRGSWAQVSDNNLNLYGSNYSDWYASLSTYSNGTRWNNNASLYLPGTYISPSLKPNTTISQEYGAEMNFLKNRVGLDFTYFNYLLKNFLVAAPLSTASGYDNTYVNGGSYNRKGVEIVLRGTPVQTKYFKWETIVNWDKVHAYRKSYYGGALIQNGIKVGDRMDKYFSTAWQTSPDGQVVYNSNGSPIQTPYNVDLGNTDPDWSFGFTNNLSYKNFSLSVSFDGRIGGILFDGVEAQMYDGGNHPATANSYRDDAYAGKNTYFPAGVNVTSGSVTYDPLDGHITGDTRAFTSNTVKVNYIDWVRNYYRAVQSTEIYSRTFVKLREVLLTYSLDPKLVSKTPFKSASISLTGRNLFLWTKVPFMDPDGYSSFAIAEPTYRNIGINLNIKF